MKKCGYNNKLYLKTKKKNTKTNKKTKEKKVWYNPPLSSSVRTNIRRQFIYIVKKIFQNKFLIDIICKLVIQILKIWRD